MFDFDTDLDDLYQQVILDHGRNPRNFREIEAATATANGFNPLCGDQITVFIGMEDGRIEDISFQGKGCAICTASASMMTQQVKHKTTNEVETLFQAFHNMVAGGGDPPGEEIGKLSVFQGVRKYPIRVKCATLPWHTLKASLERRPDPVSTE